VILHIAADSSKHITYPFINFVNKNFDKNEHFFILCSKDKDIQKFENGITKDIFIQEEFFIEEMKKAKKIILHGIWYDRLCEIYKKHPSFFEKTVWNAWGDDYYRCRSEIHRWFIENVKYVVSYIDKDYELIQKRYNSKAKLIKSVMYPSNLYKEFKLPVSKNKKIHMQVGNSADPANNHLEIFKKLEGRKKIKIFVPLVYGDEKYKKMVIKEGKRRFKNNFFPITKRMELKKYVRYLSTIDIAVFNHNRQQAMGNIITLLGLGKKVCLKKEAPHFHTLSSLGLKIFDINDINKKFSKFDKLNNSKIVKRVFSQKAVIKQLKDIFE